MPFRDQKSKILKQRGTAPSPHSGIEKGPLPTPYTAFGARPPSCFWAIRALVGNKTKMFRPRP